MSVAPFVPPKLNLPETAAFIFENSFRVFAGMKGFEDRVAYANGLIQECSQLRFFALCSVEDEAAMLRRVRSELQSDLGVIPVAEPRSIFDVAEQRGLRGDL